MNVCAVCEFRSKVRPRTSWCVVMGIAVLFILRSILLLYSTGSGVNRVHVALSGFNVKLLCFVQAKTLCMYVRICCTRACVCVDVMSSA